MLQQQRKFLRLNANFRRSISEEKKEEQDKRIRRGGIGEEEEKEQMKVKR